MSSDDGRSTITDLLYDHGRSVSRGIKVCIPARVVRIQSPGTVDVVLGAVLPSLEVDGEPTELPNLIKIPVIFPATQAGALGLRVQVGDTGEVIFSDVHLGAWLSGAEDAPTPTMNSFHGLSGGVFHPGLAPEKAFVTPATVDALLESRGGEALEVDGGEVRCGRGATEAAVLGNLWKTAFDGFLTDLTTFIGVLEGIPGHAGVGTVFKAEIVTLKALSNYIAGVSKVK